MLACCIESILHVPKNIKNNQMISANDGKSLIAVNEVGRHPANTRVSALTSVAISVSASSHEHAKVTFT